jgi:hypothetical protein
LNNFYKLQGFLSELLKTSLNDKIDTNEDFEELKKYLRKQ